MFILECVLVVPPLTDILDMPSAYLDFVQAFDRIISIEDRIPEIKVEKYKLGSNWNLDLAPLKALAGEVYTIILFGQAPMELK